MRNQHANTRPLPNKGRPKNPPGINHCLWRARKRRLLSQKQVGYLLGHKSQDQIHRYEHTLIVPSLLTAIKLELIYGIPIKWLFPGLTLQARHQVQDQIAKSAHLRKRFPELTADLIQMSEFCGFNEKFKHPNLTPLEKDIIRQHIRTLVQKSMASVDQHSHKIDEPNNTL
jgi:transcriptional regulator with XRE-family HTH domain